MAECCAERGYAETTIDDVLERARLGRESFDSHFVDKEDCGLAALNRIVAETLAAISTVDAQGSEPARRLRQVRTILELMSAQPAFARLGYIEARHAATRRLHDGYESAAHVLMLMMERGQEAGAQPPATAARGALGGAEAVVRRELCAGTPPRLSRFLPDFIYAALVPFAGQREALRQANLAMKLIAEEE
jgi:TetR/AcrR family transcriptional regulator